MPKEHVCVVLLCQTSQNNLRVVKMDSDISGDPFSGYDLITAEDVEECQREFETNGVGGCQRLLEAKLEAWKEIPLNVAVIGNSGVGKSSFINAIRCVSDQKMHNAVRCLYNSTMFLWCNLNRQNKPQKQVAHELRCSAGFNMPITPTFFGGRF